MKLFQRSSSRRPPASGPTVRIIPPPPPEAAAALRALIAPLPPFAREELTRSTLAVSPLPQDAPALFARMHALLVGAGIAEGRGGYPGGRGRPGWPEYVEEQRRRVAVLKAMAEAWGWPTPSIKDSVRSYEEHFTPSVRLMGEGDEPHVDDMAGRLIYAIPVDAGLASESFTFPILRPDLDVLLADRWRRAVLEAVLPAALQRSMLPGAPEVTELEFSRIKKEVLHATPDALARSVELFSQAYGADVALRARQALARRDADGGGSSA